MTELPQRTHDDGRHRLVALDVGAHLTGARLDGQELLWLSPRAVLDGSAPVRGGIPLCFPWFAGGPEGDLSPSHGVARTATWRPTGTTGTEVWAWQLEAADVANAPGAEHVPPGFRTRYAVSLGEPGGPGRLRVRLEVHNPTRSGYRVEAALHTYLAVSDVRTVLVDGLDGAAYLDKVTGRRGHQHGPVRVDGETDRVFDAAPAELRVCDGTRTVLLRPEGATQAVVWNPGPEKAAATGDLGAGVWTDFVCVETAATGKLSLRVPAGGTTSLGCTFTVPRDTEENP
jgi:glucose-6-phosphate 1-epimerase